MTSFAAVLIAGPLAIAIALFLTRARAAGVRGVIGSLVEMLAAVPSVVLGLWGIFVLGPFVRDHLDPWLHSLVRLDSRSSAARRSRPGCCPRS